MRRSRLRDARALLVAGFSGQSVIIVRDEISEMHATLRRLVREEAFDVVHADQTSMAQYALFARAKAQQRLRLLLDVHNALYRIPERMAAHERNPLKRLLLKREAQALARYEANAYRRFDHVVFVTDQDRQALQGEIANRNPQSAIRNPQSVTIPICVDPEEKPLVERVPQPRAIVHLGTMFWPPNVEGTLWFAREVWPRVVAQVPEATFTVVGKNPPAPVQALVTHHPSYHPEPVEGRITVTGYVPDVIPYLRQAAVFVVPLHSAGGMRVKILDAWCWGVPIISTSIGAEGIAVRDGDNILIADTAKTFAQAVVRLLQEPTLGERLRQNGRRWVEERYNWRRVYARWDEVYSRLIAA